MANHYQHYQIQGFNVGQNWVFSTKEAAFKFVTETPTLLEKYKKGMEK